MIKRGISGGMLKITSLIESSDRQALVNNAMIKTSSSIREAAKIGLQSLYANADEVLDKYKDFDIIKEMKSRDGANLLWVRARAIDANVVNTNGDYFSEEELLKEAEYQGKMMPAYKTFEGVPIYTNHQNDKIEEAKGMVVYSEWDDDEKCVYCVFFVDEDAYPDITRGIRQGYIHDVSMGCSVDEGRCSICNNKATTEKDYCDCLKNYKGKIHPSGKRAYEYNYGIKFIELSCVGDGAFENCEIEELYDQEEIVAKARAVVTAANKLNSSISLAASIHDDISDRHDIEAALRLLQNINNNFIRIAQTAGTLVGGQILGNGTAQNATVVKILQGLGIDPGSNLNILDLVNLALNFLEVAVLNLFSRKDNIDLTHVAKLTKAMGELQNTLQDMIDDGIETATRPNAPMIPPQQAAPPMAVPQAPVQGQPTAAPVAGQQGGNAVPQIQTQNALFEPQVGTMISPFSQQPYVMPLGGGVSAETNKTRFVWASANNNEEIITKSAKLNKFGKFALALDGLREACGIALKNKDEVILNTPQKNTTVSSGDKKIMDTFKKIAQDARNQNTVAVGIDINLEDKSGNRLVMSTEKGINGFHKGQLTNWKPTLSDSQIAQMENNDGYKVAAELLKDFSDTIKKAEADKSLETLVVLDSQIENERLDELVNLKTKVNEHHEGFDGKNLQQKLNEKRYEKDDSNTMESLLNNQRKSGSIQIVTKLASDAKKSLGEESLEKFCLPNLKLSNVPGKLVMNQLLQSIVRTCMSTNTSPQEVVEFLTKAAATSDFPKIFKLARVGKPAREFDDFMQRLSQSDLQPEKIEPIPSTPDTESYIETSPEISDSDIPVLPTKSETDQEENPMEESAITDLADNTDPDITEGDIMSALTVIKDNFSEAVAKLDDILNKNKPTDEKIDKLDDMKNSLTSEDDDIDNDSMKGAVTGLSLSGEDSGAEPSELIDSVNEMPTDKMSEEIEKARLPGNAMARANNRNVKTASAKNVKENIIGWLADVANSNNLSTEKITLATKLFCHYKEAAEKILNKSIKTSEVKVTDETIHSTTIVATLDDIGVDVKDASFNEKFRDFAVELLSKSGYEVDPMTFALTEINVSEDGCVYGKVSSSATKTFYPKIEEPAPEMGYVDEDREMMASPEPMIIKEEEPKHNMPLEELNQPAVMSAGAKAAKRLSRLQNVIKVAQGLGLPGAAAPAAGAPMNTPALGGDMLGNEAAGMAGGPADLGLSSFTGSTPAEGENINDSPEPGTKSPWGSVCPQCGSKDVDIANGEGNCNSCGAQLKYKFIVEVAPPEEKGDEEEALPPTSEAAPAAPEGGIGAEAPGGAGFPAPVPGAGAPQVAGMPNAASKTKIMTRVAYRTSADVYVQTTREDFNKQTAEKLPVGLICPACGSREASKKSKYTSCYKCNTMSVSDIKRVENEPGIIEATITWI